jgi:drug/metabolite transporter (DMT)-like permease
MFLWVIITIIAHLLNAIVFIIDKHLVSKTVMKPVAYAFYSGIFQFAYLALLPFGFSFPKDKYLVALAIFIGALFIFTLVIFYKAMRIAESTRVIPIVGGLIPIFTLFLAYFLLGERLGMAQLASFVLFIFGGFLLSAKFSNGKTTIIKGLFLAALAAFLFAVYYVLMKILFLRVSFLDGFIAIQLGGFLGALALALSVQNRKLIFSPASATSAMKKETFYLFVPDKILAAVAAILIYYAVSLEEASVTIINSLQSVQYAFLLILAVILSKKFPYFFREQVGEKVIIQKAIAIFLISAGLFILTSG